MSEVKGEYFTQLNLDKNTVQVIIKRLIDKNNVLRYYDEDMEDSLQSKRLNLTIRGQIFVDEAEYNLKKETAVFDSSRGAPVNELIQFEDHIRDLPYTSFLCLSLHSLDREDDSPIASTTISLYDQNLKLRQGTYLLLLWPETHPDASFESTTPGLISHEYLGKFNANKRILKDIESWNNQGYGNNDYHTNKSLENLRNKQHYLESSVPFAFLEIDLPLWGKEVLFEDRMHKIKGASFKCREIGSKIGNVFPANEFQKFFMPSDNFTKYLVVRDFDHDFERDELILDKYYQAIVNEGDVSNLVPNKEEKQKLLFIMKKPNFSTLPVREKSLVWRMRYFLRDNPDALPKFLKSVTWYIDKNATEALKLTEEWAEIKYDDAIFLLSRDFCANDIYPSKINAKIGILSMIREYAVGILRNMANEEITFIILQLVSALRYELMEIKSSPLVQLLLEACSEDRKLAMLCYWHLTVECESKNESVKNWFTLVKNNLVEYLRENSPTVHAAIANQAKFRRCLYNLSDEILKRNKANKARKADLRKTLADRSKVADMEGRNGELFLINPEKAVTTLNPNEATVFKSNTAPFLLSFNTTGGQKYKVIYKNGDDLRMDQLIIQMIVLMDHLMKDLNLDLRLTIYQVLAYGSVDGIMEFVPNSDTLQDILEDHRMLTNFFKKLTKDKMKAEMMKSMLDQTASTASRSRTATNTPPEDYIDPQIMDNYIESLAGYCIITYFLGIGDRHLENLMLDNTGKIFHIDFGFAMGEDPKMSNPPPFKLTGDMIQPLGSHHDPLYKKFLSRCVTYFLYLRKHSKLILNLLYLMLDSELIVNPKNSKQLGMAALEKVAQKFILNENEKNAEVYFNKLLKDSLDDIWGNILDTFHKWWVKVKN